MRRHATAHVASLHDSSAFDPSQLNFRCVYCGCSPPSPIQRPRLQASAALSTRPVTRARSSRPPPIFCRNAATPQRPGHARHRCCAVADVAAVSGGGWTESGALGVRRDPGARSAAAMPRRGLPLAQAQFFSPARYPPHAAARNATAIGKNSGLCIPAHGGEVTQHFEHFFGGLRLSSITCPVQFMTMAASCSRSLFWWTPALKSCTWRAPLQSMARRISLTSGCPNMYSLSKWY